MSEAIFGLIGVIVGGLLQGGWSWAMDHRRESWAARKAGRLFGPALIRCSLAINHAVEHGSTWGELVTVVSNNLDRWPSDADVFAGTLDWDEWSEIYSAVRALEKMGWTAPRDPEQPVSAKDHTYLRALSEQVLDGALTCAAVGVAGKRVRGWQRWSRRLRTRVPPRTEKALLTEVLGDEDAAEEIMREDDEPDR